MRIQQPWRRWTDRLSARSSALQTHRVPQEGPSLGSYSPAPATRRHSPARCSLGDARRRPGSGSADRKLIFGAPTTVSPPRLGSAGCPSRPAGLRGPSRESPPAEEAFPGPSPGCCATSRESSRCPGCWCGRPGPWSSACPSRRCCGDATAACCPPCCEPEAGEVRLRGGKSHLLQPPLTPASHR